jgi:hypothetical protein
VYEKESPREICEKGKFKAVCVFGVTPKFLGYIYGSLTHTIVFCGKIVFDFIENSCFSIAPVEFVPGGRGAK